ncbi:glucoamylase family protein [Aquabacterium sp. OR-4]|uniref:glucoamylase family protein n=1 Tax=Aquabacterium sp. OR-4 TaxID=2978127 RepID=UPI0021B3B455|nr:glucoamylase family protein [Aquabacterium sp. OR-4]MDT7835928.1 glucoamylase family protein [Aquabacterium sp. OR-4]
MPASTRRRLLAAAAATGALGWLPGCRTEPPAPARSQGLAPASVPPRTLAAAEAAALLDDLERRTFDYFWQTTDAATGLAPDRWPTPSFASIAATGFALTAWPLGVQRGWVSREAARERVLNTLRSFLDAPMGPQASGTAGHHGFYYHFLDMRSGTRFARCELSTIDTALLLAGLLCCQSFFDGAQADETRLRDGVDEFYRRIDWAWAMPRAPRIGHGWHPESGFISSDWRAYDESMLLYLLALGAPSRPVGREAWDFWASGLAEAWGSQYGQAHLRFAPLFGHQFTQCWVDLRGLHDGFMRGMQAREPGLDYFENSRRATHAQRAYAMVNPEGWAAYGPEVWGVSACDGPADVQRAYGGRMRRFISYAGRGMGGAHTHDDGTLAPYAAGSSIAFAPEIVLPALATMRARWGEHLYGRYGFFDAFNPSFDFADVRLTHGRVVPGQGWFDTDYLGIDQGPMLAMLGNHRGEVVWQTMRRNAHLRRGLQRAGFQGGWLG